MTLKPSSAQVLVRLLSIFAETDKDMVRSRTIETLAEFFDASIVGILDHTNVVDSVGLGPFGGELAILGAKRTGNGLVNSDIFGPMQVLTMPIPDTSDSTMVLARADHPFSGEEAMAVRAAIRMMKLAAQTTATLQSQRRSTDLLEKEIKANRALTDRLQDRHESLMSRVLHIQKAVTHATHHEETLELIAQTAGELFGSDSIAVRRVDNPEGRSLWTVNIEPEFAQTIPLIDPTRGISRRAMDENALVVEQTYRPLHLPDRGGTVSALAAPIYCQGQSVGAMTVLAGPDRCEPHTEEDQEALIIMAGYVSVAITKAAATEELERSLLEAQWRASHDHLTGLPNRARIIEIIETQLAEGLTPVVLYIDFDGFKSVNDLYGHVTGDLALIAVAERLALMLRAGESIARLAGDEFVALLPPTTDQTALLVAERIVAKLAKPLDVDGRDLVLPASVGIANIAADSAEELLEAADLAMYRAKSMPSESIAFFDNALRQDRTRRVSIEQQLRLSLVDMSSFSLNYQPIVQGEEFEVCGYEALLRWDTQSLGIVSPDEFIAVAEETGIISQIDEWVLATALRESGLIDEGERRISVNLSAASFLRGYLPSLVERTLLLSGASPAKLAIEITERVMLGDSQLVRNNIGALRELGVAVVLDDFGVGYSSLSYLRDLEIDGLKIDRSFVHGATGDARGAAVLRAVLGLAADLGIETVAEGVETPGQLEQLRALGCSHYQGYLFGRPAPVDRIIMAKSRSSVQ